MKYFFAAFIGFATMYLLDILATHHTEYIIRFLLGWAFGTVFIVSMQAYDYFKGKIKNRCGQ
jgi:hypothetical protein